ncbi:MAG: GEVED domain-containing protein [Crocinitomicaceae bacterium]|nr:GEVED domain-containing protein [Crocinitomicaceae bacterium]
MTIGQTYTISINISNFNVTTKLMGWIDYNNNGVFEVGTTKEILIFSAISSTSLSTTFTVPATAQTVTTRMRLCFASGPNSSYGPCDESFNLDAEDYLVDIVSGSGCMDPVVSLGSITTLCTDSTLVLDAGNPGLSHSWNTGQLIQQSQSIKLVGIL